MDQFIFESIDGLLSRLVTDSGDWFSSHGFRIAFILLILLLAYRYGSQFIRKLFHRTIRPDLYPTKIDRERRIKTLDSLIGTMLKIAVVVIGSIMIVSELGLDTTPLIASAGVLGVALGFGAQNLIKDITSGVFIISENQYRVGDIVQLINGSNEVTGTVEAIGLRTTVLRTLDGMLYHAPNGSIVWTANKTMSYGGIEEDIVFPIDCDISKLKLLIDRVGTEIAEDPEFQNKIKQAPHLAQIVGFDPNGIKVKILATTTTASSDAWDVKGEFYKRLIIALRKAKIQIPYAQITVHQAKK